MSLDDGGIRRAGLAYSYRTIPVLIATLLFGFYIIILFLATKGLIERGRRANFLTLFILYVVFAFTSTLWALQITQLFGIRDYILTNNDNLSTNQVFANYYDFIARQTKLTAVLFQCQVRSISLLFLALMRHR